MYLKEKQKKSSAPASPNILSTSPTNSRVSSVELPIVSQKKIQDYPIIDDSFLKADFSNGVTPLIFQEIIHPDIYLHHIDLEELVWHPSSSSHDANHLGSYTSGNWNHNRVTLVLSTTHYYILNRDLNNGVESKRDLRDIHSVETLLEACNYQNITSLDMDQKLNGFKLVYQTAVSKNKLKSTEMESFLHEKIFIADSEDTRDLTIMAIRAVLRRFWQSNFETIYMQGSEVYQIHRFVTKTNKKGRNQIRCIALSSEKMYNLQAPGNYPLIPGKVKWSCKIGTLHGVQSTEPKMLIVKADLPRGKTDVTLVFKDELEKIEMLTEIRRLYTIQTKTPLPELKISSKPLKKSAN